MKPAATHKGHCQACGRIQKLPKGVLSQHGYTVSFGFFHGICPGYNHLPYEQSCELIQGFVNAAKQSLAATQRQRLALLQSATEPTAWIRNFEGPKPGYNDYRWIRVGLVQAGDRFLYYANGKDGATNQPHLLESYQLPLRLPLSGDARLAVATHLNARKAKWLEAEVNSLSRYIVWQEHRIKQWELRELLPLDQPEGSVGFKPTKPE